MQKAVEINEIFPLIGFENGCLLSKEKGCYTFPIKLTLPEVYTLDDDDYTKLNSIIEQIIEVIGEDHLLHFQNYFYQTTVQINKDRIIYSREEEDFLSEYNERYFKDRMVQEVDSYLFITKTPKNYYNFKPTRVNQFLRKRTETFLDNSIPKEFLNETLFNEFLNNAKQVIGIINSSELMKAQSMSNSEVIGEKGIINKFFSLSNTCNFTGDLNFENNTISAGDKKINFYTVENPDQLNGQYYNCKDCSKFQNNKSTFPIGNLFELGFKFPTDHIINQYIYIAPQEKLIQDLTKRQTEFRRFSRSDEDPNYIYAESISNFKKELTKQGNSAVFYHLNVMAITEDPEGFEKIQGSIKSRFNDAGIKVNPNHIDRINLYWASFPGNSIGLSSELYIPMTSELAASLTYFEGPYNDERYNPIGMRVTDRITGLPVYLDMYKGKEKSGLIYNRNIVGLSASGGGKSFIFNHYLVNEFKAGSYISILDAGKSYDGITSVSNGVLLEHSDNNPFSFNPFLLDLYDTIEIDGNKEITEGKLLFLYTLINIISGGGHDNPKNIDEQLKYKAKEDILQKGIKGYYQHMFDNGLTNFNFDSYYEFISGFLLQYIKKKNIKSNYFDCDLFLSLIEIYKSDNSRGELLNKQDARFDNLSEERFVNFEINSLIGNEMLFPIVSLLIMDLFLKKLYDQKIRHINKIILVDEAWAAFDRKELEGFFLHLVKTARKMGGQTIFISQEPNDFIKSEVIKGSIINNSDIKVFLDMSKYKKSFDDIQRIMGITDKQKQLILSLNKDNRKGEPYREACICWMDSAKVYGIETSKVEKALYETNPYERKKINQKLEKYHNNWRLTAVEYATEK